MNRYDDYTRPHWGESHRWAALPAVTAAGHYAYHKGKALLGYGTSGKVTPSNSLSGSVRKSVKRRLPHKDSRAVKKLKFVDSRTSQSSNRYTNSMPLRRRLLRRRAMRSRRRKQARRRARTHKKTRGLSIRRVGKGIRAKASQPSLYGAEFKRDVGGIMEDRRAVYIGHATMMKPEMLNIFSRALVRKLFMLAGIDFQGWQTLVNDYSTIFREDGATDNKMVIWYTYFLPNDLQPGTTTRGRPLRSENITWNTSEVPAAIAFNLVTSLRNNLYRETGPGVIEPLGGQGAELIEIFLGKGEPTTTEGNSVIYERYASIQANRYKITFDMRSLLKIQNLTTAAQVTGTVNQLINDVGNNPLQGLYYTNYGNNFKDTSMTRTGNAVLTNARDSINVEQQGYVANNNNGLMRRDAGSSNYAMYPPNPKVLNARTGNYLVVKPGSIKTSKLFHQKTFTINSFMTFMRDQITNTGSDNTFIGTKFGKCAMFGLRHMINFGQTGSPLVEDDVRVKVGYELRWSYGCYLTKTPTKPIAPDIVTRNAGGAL